MQQPDSFAMVRRLAQKEMTLFFSSPTAYLFLAAFAVVTLFVFFWVEAFFARNIADVRPLFEWMPLLLIFLASTLTMRLWSEERRSGTIEHIFTQPLSIWTFVLGKFLGCLLLLLIALMITLPLPITISFLGELDWGPVIAGYLAAFLWGAAYLAIGLYVSARSENQIVSLIISVAICGVFYLIGSNAFTSFFGQNVASVLQAVSTSARFESIAKGVIDFRDLYYYFSLVALFLTLNAWTLEKERWSKTDHTAHRLWHTMVALVIANALLANGWLGYINALRVDVTEGKIYSISDATKKYLKQLKEPLLIRGYFSQKTHPLLAPLVPQLKDLIEEYQIAGGDKVRVEIIDPAQNPEAEKEANEKYNIRPVPFQVNDRYQSAIVSSYFDVLVQYGNEHEVLGFRDLIEVKSTGDTNLDVLLRNPEHDLTSAIKKVLYAYQSSGNLFETVKRPLTLTAYVSEEARLPAQLKNFKKVVEEVTQTMQKQAGDKLQVKFVDPEANDGKVAKEIAEKYGLQPMTVGLFSNQYFYFYLLLSDENQVVQLPLDGVDKAAFERNFKAGIKRFATGFTKTVAVVAPEVNPQMARFGMGGAQFNQLRQFLGEDYTVKSEDLSDGKVSGDADLLMLLAPKDLDEKSLFAIDQFLMQGGTVIAATSPYSMNLMGRRLSLQKHHSGMKDWLKSVGVLIDDKVVLDPQNSAFPVPVTRNIGGFQVQEMRMLDYPYFVDVRDQGLNQELAVTSGLPQVTMAWSSPIELDNSKLAKVKSHWLIKSSEGSWLSDSLDVMPQIDAQGRANYQPQGEQKSHTLAVMLEGQFTSYFADKNSPLLPAEEEKSDKKDNKANQKDESKDTKSETWSGVIKHSPPSARLIVFASNDFVEDQVIQMAGAASGSEYMNTRQLVANAIDWSLQDQGLMAIRSRGHFNRTLPPMSESEQAVWEYVNYGLALLAIFLTGLIQRIRRNRRYLAFQQAMAN